MSGASKRYISSTPIEGGKDMARKADYSNIHKYDDRRSFDGQTILDGKVLGSFLKEKFGSHKDDDIQDNFTTMHLGGFTFEIGSIAIDEKGYVCYMKDFWGGFNKEMEMRREGRCIIDKDPDGTDKLCPYTRRCKGCLNKGLLERYNLKCVEILSIDYEYDGDAFDIEDTSKLSVADQVLNKLCLEPSEEELKIKFLAYFDKESPRYAKIIRLNLLGMSIEDICIEINEAVKNLVSIEVRLYLTNPLNMHDAVQ